MSETMRNGAKMCNTDDSGFSDERQRLENELSYLTGLINKHKVKHKVKPAPAVIDNSRSASSKAIRNQFSWTKKGQTVGIATQPGTSSVKGMYSIPSVPSYEPSRQQRKWKQSAGNSTSGNPSSKFKFVKVNIADELSTSVQGHNAQSKRTMGMSEQRKDSRDKISLLLDLKKLVPSHKQTTLGNEKDSKMSESRKTISSKQKQTERWKEMEDMLSVHNKNQRLGKEKESKFLSESSKTVVIDQKRDPSAMKVAPMRTEYSTTSRSVAVSSNLNATTLPGKITGPTCSTTNNTSPKKQPSIVGESSTKLSLREQKEGNCSSEKSETPSSSHSRDLSTSGKATTSVHVADSRPSTVDKQPTFVNKKVKSKTNSQSHMCKSIKSEKLTNLANELDKCLRDIASFKKAQGLAKSNPEKTVKSQYTSGTSADSELPSTSSNVQRISPGTTNTVKLEGFSQNKSEVQKELLTTDASKLSCSTAHGSVGQNCFKWTAPSTTNSCLASQENASSSIKAISNVTSGSLHNKFTRKIILPPSSLLTNPQMKVIRTKYKMKKQPSTPKHLSASKGNSRFTYSKDIQKVKEKMPQKSSRYKFVKSQSHSASSSISQTRTSTTTQQKLRKSPVAFSSRYKRVKGKSTKRVTGRKLPVVVPHRSQLKLVRNHPRKSTSGKRRHIIIPHQSQLKLTRKSHMPNALKKRSPSLQLQKRSSPKLGLHSRSTPVIRSRYKMRKVAPHTPTRVSRKPTIGSPYKWEAKKALPSRSTPQSSFMQRRMQYVLRHTPVLLRTRFRLVNSFQHSNHGHSIRPGLTVPASQRTRKIQQQPLVKKTRMKIVRKSANSPSKGPTETTVVNAKGVHYHQSKSGKSLKRIQHHSVSPLASRLTAHSWSQDALSRVWTASAHKLHHHCNPKVSSTQWVANRVLRRTIQGKINRNIKNQTNQPYCKFYNRYGRCHRGDKCPFIHDPDRVAVCTQFLRGTCKKTDGSCPFSHKVSKDKMPVCVYFLKGVCNRDDCPYSHVKVSKTAEVCPEFLHGYCPLGAKCKKKHTLECGEFNRTGHCKLGKACPMWHRQVRRNDGDTRRGVKRRGNETNKATIKRSAPPEKFRNQKERMETGPDSGRDEENEDCKEEEDDDADDADSESVDDRSGSMPSFIALDTDYDLPTPEASSYKHDWMREGAAPTLKIRPLFAQPSQTLTVHQPKTTAKNDVPIATRYLMEDGEKEEEEDEDSDNKE